MSVFELIGSSPKFRASSSDHDATTFQPERPLLIRSNVANLRARLYGSLYVVDAVVTRPTWLVTMASAGSNVIGSSSTMSRPVRHSEPRGVSP